MMSEVFDLLIRNKQWTSKNLTWSDVMNQYKVHRLCYKFTSFPYNHFTFLPNGHYKYVWHEGHHERTKKTAYGNYSYNPVTQEIKMKPVHDTYFYSKVMSYTD